MHDLKARAVRGGFAKLLGEGLNFILRLIYIVVMARLLDPSDFGLVAMVTAVTGFYSLFITGGLSAATVQRATITDEQISTLFWINLTIGILLAFLCLVSAPVVVRFYGEPRLFWVMVTIAAGFLFTGATVQHMALIDRQLRFVALTTIEVLCQTASIAIGIYMAVAGFGYWALVASTVSSQIIFAISMWTLTGWIPGAPRRSVGTVSMLRFGGTYTLNNVVVYVAYNLDKVLLGRFWGADALGLYSRAYQLINIPTQNLNAAIGGIAFAALSRLQNEPARLKNYFLKGYQLANSLTLPITVFCASFADDIILVALGPRWTEAATIFRMLSPTILVFGIINPLGSLLYSTGLQMRSLLLALVIAPIAITAYIVGLPYGPNGVALAFSTAMTLWLVPHVLWSLRGTAISPWDILSATSKPLLSALLAATVAITIQYFTQLQSPYLRLGLETIIMGVVYFGTLLFIMGQKTLYFDLLKEFRRPL